MKDLANSPEAHNPTTIAGDTKPVAKPIPNELHPIFGLGKDQCPPVPWSAFAAMPDDEADWGL